MTLTSRTNWGLRARLVTLVLGTVALLSTALWLFLPARLDHLSARWSESRSLGVTRLIGRLAAASLDADDAEAAAGILSELWTARDVRYAVLFRPDGRALATWGTAPDGAPPPRTGERVLSAGGLVHASVPVPTLAGQHGAIMLGFDLAELEERRGQTRQIVGLAAVLLLGLAIPAAFAIGAFTVVPLRQVTRVARRIAAGDASARSELPVCRHDEVGALAAAFDVMLARLYEQEAGIRTLNAELEGRVARRTAELEQANQEIAQRLAELSRTQEKLVSADRRITIGRLAAGVAHEINNPLAYVEGNLHYLDDEVRALCAKLPRGETGPGALHGALEGMASAIADSRHGAARVRHIVRGLKTYSRSDSEVLGPVSLQAALEGAIDMAGHEVKLRAQLVTRIGPLPLVLGHEVRLSQVFLNLLVNAAQAFPEGAAEDNQVRVTAFTDDRGQAVVEVADTGAGMTREVQARLFEPFFTTKPVGEGTGLGLSISRGLVERSGGRIEVESEVGRGSTFRVVIPAVDVPVATPPEATPEPSGGQRFRLLVLDDEPLVCRAMQRSMEREHEVVTETRARAALERISAGERFDAILCDLQMPEMNGFQFKEALEKLAPQLVSSVIFLTGGAVGPAAERLLADPATVWLRKPVDFGLLSRLLQDRAA